MKFEFSCLYWNNVDERMLSAHKRVMNHFHIKVNYYNIDGLNHGTWMQWVIERSPNDVIVFIEPDCIPLNFNFLEYIKFAHRNDTFLGIAQVANHIAPQTHIYAGPGFYAISKKAYEKLGRPNLQATESVDTAEAISYIAEKNGIKYRALMPTYFEKQVVDGPWHLGNLGYFGIGTVYDNSIYHLFQARMAQNISLFTERCAQVIDGKFTTHGFISSTALII